MLMKHLYPVLLCLLSSCMEFIPQESLQPTPNSLSNIPIHPHQHEVKVFLQNEQPTEPYYKIKLVEVRDRPDASMESMLLAIKEKARLEGMDAVLLDDLGKQAANQLIQPELGGVLTYQRMVGIGIRYRRTIDYMDSLVKRQSVKVWLPGSDDPKQFDISFDFNGACYTVKDRFADSLFNTEIYPYAAFEIPYGNQPGWAYKADTSLSMLLSKKREYYNATLVCNYVYNDAARLAAIDIRKPVNNTAYKRNTQQLRLVFESRGLLAKKILYEKEQIQWRELLSYTLSGKLEKTERFKLHNGKKIPLLETSFEYYSQNDLPPPQQPAVHTGISQ